MSAAQKTRWARIFRWSVTILLVGWLLTLIDLRETLRILATARLDLVLLVLAVLVAIRLFMAWRWWYVLRVLGVDARFIEVFRITMISIALSLVMPGGHAAVDAYRTWSMSRLRGTMSTIIASVAADRIFGFYSLILLAFLAVLLAPDLPGEIDWRSTISWAFAGATIIVAVLVGVGPKLISSSASLLLWWPRARGAVMKVADHLRDRNTLRRISIPSTLLALPVQILRGVEFYLIYKAVGADIGLLFMLIYAPLVFFLMLLPISVAGIGVREGSFYLFLAPHGVSVETIVAAGVLFHVLGIIMGLPGAMWISKRSVVEEISSVSAEPPAGADRHT